MSITRKALFTLAALGLTALAAHPASAQTMITVLNSNFSMPTASGPLQNGDYTTGEQIPDWSDAASAPGNSGYGVQKDTPYATAPDPDGGVQFLYVNQGNVFQTISLGSFAAGTTFTVSGDVLHRSDGYGAGIGTISLFALNADGTLGTEYASATSTPATPGNYDFVSATSLGALPVPSQVAIELSAPAAGDVQSDYDNIHLSANAPASAAPEPAQIGILALVALGLGALAFKARKRTTAAQTA